jgi:hypothetical protein
MTTKEYYTLREVARELDLSEVWARRMVTKGTGLLAGKAVKIEGEWRFPAKYVEELKKQYAAKRVTTEKRKRGEIPRYQFQYVPDRVKACQIAPILLKEYKNDLTEQELEKVVTILQKIEKAEIKKYNQRKKERKSKEQAQTSANGKKEEQTS